MIAKIRDMAVGKHLNAWSHLGLVGDPEFFDACEHLMRREDIVRKDPMSVATVQRTVSKSVRRSMRSFSRSQRPHSCDAAQVRACLRRIREGVESKKTPGTYLQEDTIGTETWLEVISMFLRIFFSKKDSLGTRIFLCAAVVSFLRIKRHWIANDRSYTLTRNAESREAFQHTVMQVESAALKIQLRCEQNADAEKKGEQKIPVCLSKSGSDCCESEFSQLAG
jgi:hypothetical protein